LRREKVAAKLVEEHRKLVEYVKARSFESGMDSDQLYADLRLLGVTLRYDSYARVKEIAKNLGKLP
jgi:hypothetical protein